MEEQYIIELKRTPIDIGGVIQHSGEIAIIDNNIFYSQEILDFLVDNEVTYNNNKIFCGEKDSEYIDLLDTDSFYDLEGLRKDLYGILPTDLYQTITMGGISYNKGLALYNDYSAYFNVKGNYKRMRFIVGHVDGTHYQKYKLSVIGDGKTLLDMDIDIEGLPQELELDISAIKQIVFTTKTDELTTNGCTIGIADIYVN